MSSKELTHYNYWMSLIADAPEIEELEIAGINRHREECFKVATHLVGGEPRTSNELDVFFQEYIRQLIGPEIYDVYAGKSAPANIDVGKTFRIIRKYTRGV